MDSIVSVKFPIDQIRRAIHHPKKTLSYLSEHPYAIIEEVITPFKARYLFDRVDDWELAIILDACRYDLGVEASREHNWLPEPEAVWSPGAHSREWMRRTFESAPEEVLEETVYISANQFTASVVDDLPLQHCEEVWRYSWDEDRGCVPPRPVTDRTISAIRNDLGSRYVAHYMQPHLPPLNPTDDDLGEMDPDEGWSAGNPWRRVESGDLESDLAQSAYMNNIDGVLDEVRLLLSNANVSGAVITADHGNYLGEDGKWGHEKTHQLSTGVRLVPWWVVSATDTHSHEPAQYTTEETNDRAELLEALGYQ